MDKSEFSRAIVGDRQTLRDAVKVFALHQLTPPLFFSLPAAEIEQLIRSYVSSIADGQKVPAAMERPASMTCSILHAYQRLLARNLDASLPRREPPAKHGLSPLPETKRPAQAVRDLARINRQIEGQPSGSGTGEPTTQANQSKKIVVFWQYAAIIAECGIELNDDVSVADMFHPGVIAAVQLRLPNHFAKGTIPTKLSSLKSIASDVLGKSHCSVDALIAAAKRHHASQSLSSAVIDECRDLNDCIPGSEAALTIWDLSEEMKTRSEMAGLRRCDRDVRFACAVAVELAIAITSMSVDSIHNVNYERDLSFVGEARHIQFVDKLGRRVSLPLGARANRFINDHTANRELWGLRSPWLFASGRDRKKQRQKNCLSQLIATNIEAALTRRVSLQRVQDAAVINAIDTGSVSTVEMSDAFGHKYPRSFRARFAVALQAPLNDEDGDEG